MPDFEKMSEEKTENERLGFRSGREEQAQQSCGQVRPEIHMYEEVETVINNR